MTEAPHKFASPEELSERDRFFHAFGKALAAWAEIERALSLWFGQVAGVGPGMAENLFFAGKSFNTRVDLLSAALENPNPPSEWHYFVKEAIARATAYSSTRNRLAHGGIHPNEINDVGHADWRVKEPTDWQSKDGLSYETIQLVAKNFNNLSALIREGYVRHAMQERHLESLRRLLQLPSAADSTQPNQKQKERLRRLESLHTSPLDLPEKE